MPVSKSIPELFRIPPPIHPTDLIAWRPGVEVRDAVGFPGYKVGSDGSIWGCRVGGTRGVVRIAGVWKELRGTTDRTTGYIRITLRVDGKTTHRAAHRMVLEAFVGPCPPGMLCRHLNGIRTDNRLENLQWATQQVNLADRVGHGTTNWGARNGRAKHSPEVVAKVRSLFAQGMLRRQIAAETNVPYPSVCDMIRGHTWKLL